MRENPELRAAELGRRAARHRARGAAALPDPELSLELSELGGRRDRASFRGSETTLVVSQLVELGGDRAARRRRGEAGAKRALAAHDVAQRRIVADTTQAFVTLLAAQERARLAAESTALSTRVHGVVAARVEAGDASPLEEARARVELARARIDEEEAQAGLAVARRTLAAMWASTRPRFEAAEGDLTALPPLPIDAEGSGTEAGAHGTGGLGPTLVERIQQFARNSPQVATWSAELLARRAAVDEARAALIPDLSVGAGLQHFEETDDEAYLLEIGLELPLFGRGRAELRAARRELERGREERRAAELQAVTAAVHLYRRLVSAHAATEALAGEVVPAAERTFTAAERAYRIGQAPLIQVLDAQRTLVTVRAELVDAAARTHALRAELELRLGCALERLRDGDPNTLSNSADSSTPNAVLLDSKKPDPEN